MRTFVALNLPTEVGATVDFELGPLRRRWPQQPWVEAQNLHMTLAFLGEVDNDSVGTIVDRLARAAAESRPLQLQLGGAGVFPRPQHARVAWLGLEGGEALEGLWIRIQTELDRWLPEHRAPGFSPHVTVTRPKPPWKRHASELFIDSIPADLAGWCEGEVSLMRSRLSARGARYDVLASVQLGERADAD